MVVYLHVVTFICQAEYILYSCLIDRSEDKEKQKSELSDRSVLAQMLPEAMVAYLENYGADKFAQTFLGEYDTPEAIWNNEMRQFMIQKIAYHLSDFTPR